MDILAEKAEKQSDGGEARQTDGNRNIALRFFYIILISAAFFCVFFVLRRDIAEDRLMAALSLYAAIGVFFLLCAAFGVCRFDLKEADKDIAAQILDKIAPAVALTDKKGRFVYGNEAYRRLAGQPLRTPEILLARDEQAARAAYRLSCAAREGRSLQEILYFKRNPFAADMPAVFANEPIKTANQKNSEQNAAAVSEEPAGFGFEAMANEQNYCCCADVRPFFSGGYALSVWTISEAGARAESSESLRRLQNTVAHFDNAAAGLFSWDKEGRLVFYNATLAHLLKYDFSHFSVSLPLEHIFGADNAEKIFSWQREDSARRREAARIMTESEYNKSAAASPLLIIMPVAGSDKTRKFYLYINGSQEENGFSHAVLLPQYAVFSASAADKGDSDARVKGAESGKVSDIKNNIGNPEQSVDIQEYFDKIPIALAILKRNLRSMRGNACFNSMFALNAETGSEKAKAAQDFFGYEAGAAAGMYLAESAAAFPQMNREQTLGNEAGGSAAGQAILHFLAAMEERERRAVMQAIEEAFRSGSGQKIPFDVVLSGSDSRYVRLYIMPVHADGAENGGVIISAVEITQQRALEQQVEHSQKMQAVGQLAGGIAHDFNNVLTAILMSCDLLLGNHRSSDPSHLDIINIKNNADRAAALVRQLLAFSRQQTLRPEILDLTDMLADLRMLLLRLAGNSIRLKMTHGQALWAVKADQAELERVIMNLVSNARDAMPQGGDLTIATYNISTAESQNLPYQEFKTGDYVCIEVADSGSGIAPEIMEKIFDPFFTTKEVGKGTGLGLSMVYGIVRQTGGYVYCRSVLGRGTVFTIYLPRYFSEETAQSISRLTGGEERSSAAADSFGLQTLRKKQKNENITDLSGSANILLVEDEDAVRMGGVKALQSRGYTVFEAGSGVEALHIVKERRGDIDIVVSDVVMPEMDGPTLLRELQQLYPHIKFIFVSGYAQEAFAKNLPADADFSFLPKPFSLKQLASMVKDVLEEQSGQRQV